MRTHWLVVNRRRVATDEESLDFISCACDMDFDHNSWDEYVTITVAFAGRKA